MRCSITLPALFGLAACSLEPHYSRPTPAVPPSWPVGDAYLRQSEAALPSVSYSDIFRDPKLQAIIAQALANNQDLRAALANVAAARAQYRVQRAAIFPEIDASGGVTIHRPSAQGSSTSSTPGGTAGGAAGQITTTYELEGGTTAWEIDLFGRLRSLSHAAFDRYLATEAAARAVRLTLVAETANAYLTLAADRSLLAIAADTEVSAKRSVDLTRARLNGGVAPRTDLRQAETVFATAQADHAQQTTFVAQDRNALELLTGGPVADTLLPDAIETVDGMLAELPAGLDSTILLRRPDVVQAEYQLRAANAEIGAARAAFFPQVSLTGLAGVASTALSTLVTGGAFTWTVAPSATLPIFDWGARRGNLRNAKAQQELTLAQYQKAIQTAFREVSDGLARRGTIDRQVAADRLNLAASQDSLVLGMARYREGIDPYLTTLIAQRSFYAARQTLVLVRLIRAQNLVTLYQTLGGDQIITGRLGKAPPLTPW
jgi:multidrug efflux system outer membrane protein